MSYTPTSWAESFLTKSKLPTTKNNVKALTDWWAAEGGAGPEWGTNNLASYNPLNTTLPEPGSQPINSDKVQAYTSWSQGIQATQQTLDEPGHGYSAIRKDLAANAPPGQTEQAIVASQWGTKTIGSYTATGPAGAASGAPASSSGTTSLTHPINLNLLPTWGPRWAPWNWGADAGNAMISALFPLFIALVGIILIAWGLDMTFKGGTKINLTTPPTQAPAPQQTGPSKTQKVAKDTEKAGETAAVVAE